MWRRAFGPLHFSKYKGFYRPSTSFPLNVKSPEERNRRLYSFTSACLVWLLISHMACCPLAFWPGWVSACSLMDPWSLTADCWPPTILGSLSCISSVVLSALHNVLEHLAIYKNLHWVHLDLSWEVSRQEAGGQRAWELGGGLEPGRIGPGLCHLLAMWIRKEGSIYCGCLCKEVLSHILSYYSTQLQ